MIKLSISGCKGRMGLRICFFASKDPEFSLQNLMEQASHPQIKEPFEGIVPTSSPDGLEGSDVHIEFTSPKSTIENLGFCRQHNVKMVIGTTGLSMEQIKVIEDASKEIAIVYSANMSIGVNILFKIASEVAQAAPDSYKIKIIEAHHIHKKDSPSGTAKTLAQKIEQHGKTIDDIEAIREGEIVGDHKIIFESPEDTLILDHSAKTRDIFVKGALVAAKFLADKKTGLYDMAHVLNLK